MLEKACNAYLEARKGSHATAFGEARYKAVRETLDLMVNERSIIESEFIQKESFNLKKLGEAAAEARYIQIEDTAALQKIGAASSSRSKIDNAEHHGFFTGSFQSEMKNWSQIMTNALNQEAPNMDPNVKADILNLGKKTAFCEALLTAKSREDIINAFKEADFIADPQSSAYQKWENLAKDLDKPEFYQMRGSARFKHIKELKNNDEEIFSAIKQSYQDTVNFYELMENMYDDNIKSYLKKFNISVPRGEMDNTLKVFKASSKMKTSVNISTVSAEIRPERCHIMAERNIATSVMAKMLGCEDVVAKSQRASLTDGAGNTQNGMFMEEAKGQQGGNIMHSDQGRETNRALGNGELKKQLADLQILDLINGQVDRHLNNIIFQIDPETSAITGIKGIDNDQAFGLCGVNNSGYHSINLGLVTTVDKNTLECLNSITKPCLVYNMQDLLSQEEIDALWDRMETVKNWCNSDKVRKIDTDKWENESWESLAFGVRGNGYARSKMNNIFAKVGLAILPLGTIRLPMEKQEGYNEVIARTKEAFMQEGFKEADCNIIDVNLAKENRTDEKKLPKGEAVRANRAPQQATRHTPALTQPVTQTEEPQRGRSI